MTTTPDEAPTSSSTATAEPPPAGPHGDPHHGPHDGPRVTGAEMRDLRRLRRSSEDRYVAGVAGGLARHLDVDPVVVRVALAVLTLFAGSGALLYGALWLLVPRDDTGESVVTLDDRSRTLALVVAGVLATVALLGDLAGGWVSWPLTVVLVVVALLVASHHRRSSAREAVREAGREGAAPYVPPATSPYGADPFTKQPPAPTVGRPPRAPRPPNPLRRGPLLFWFTLALAALAVGVLGVVDVAGVDVPASAYPALALGVVGSLLVVGAFYGRAGGLILVGLVLAVATAGTMAVERLTDRTQEATPLSAAQVDDRYWLGAGETVLDLGEVADPAELAGRSIRVEGGVGRIEVVLPEGVDVAVSTQVGLGSATVLDRESEGDDVALNEAYDAPGTTPGFDDDALVLDVSLGLGEVEVRAR
ncbi:PspC domain-containing protein [Nocardioides alkalitolerans]|uniref:PspC domain-containing protein n=1 Tax=Nocardioides alkalitolerans TaxID=281714 RepID=UPI00041EBA63|nr:PspC domain-containing protein [Nocardioides alkalitolerans]